MKTTIPCLVVAIILTASLLAQSGKNATPPAPPKPKLAVSIKPQHVADALRAVIMSDREVYAQLLAERQRTTSPTNTVEVMPAAKQPFPPPCVVLRLGSQATASKGVEYSYVLRSLQPINPRNAPETEIETKGLQFVSTRPDLTYSAEELLGGRWYYTAVYPDVAVNESCVNCHNGQIAKSNTPFKLGDTIGALVVRIALEL